jgi:hypothetical protein
LVVEVVEVLVVYKAELIRFVQAVVALVGVVRQEVLVQAVLPAAARAQLVVMAVQALMGTRAVLADV